MVMVIRFLLDTNILSEPTKPVPDARVMSRLIANSGQLATATVAYHELMFGYMRMKDSHKRREVESFIRQNVEGALRLVPYCDEAARWHATQRARLTQRGKTPPYADSQIAAIAAVNNLILVTHNTKDFQHFQNLTVENWFE